MQQVFFKFIMSMCDWKILSIKKFGQLKIVFRQIFEEKKEHFTKYFVSSKISNTVMDDLN